MDNKKTIQKTPELTLKSFLAMFENTGQIPRIDQNTTSTLGSFGEVNETELGRIKDQHRCSLPNAYLFC